MKCLWKLFVFLGLLVLFGGCAVSRANAAEDGARQWIATHEFATNRDSNFAYKISPDGKKIAWLAVKGTSLALFIKDLESGRVFSKNSHDIWNFAWTRDSQHVVSDSLALSGTANRVVAVLSAKEGTESFSVYTPGEKGTSLIVSEIAGDNDHILVSNNARDRRYFDLFEVSLASGKSELIAENDGTVRAWLTDTAGRLAGRIRTDKARNTFQVLTSEGGYADVYTWNDDDRVTVLSVSTASRQAYLLSNKDADRVALIGLDIDTGKTRLIHEDAAVDISTVYTDPASGVPLVAVSEPDYPRNVVLDPRLGKVEEILAARRPVRLGIENTDDAVRKLVLSLTTDTGKEYYLADLDTGQTVLVGAASTRTFRRALRRMEPVELPSRDGTRLHGYLTRPDGAGPHPLIVLAHGGPWSRTVWGYDAQTQFLANRGYAVLDVNFRGSTGYGRHFEALGFDEWGGKMQDDLDDAAAWALAQGLAVPGKVGIMGWSYGGYAAAMGVTTAPERFACGIAVNGPLDLIELVEDLAPAWHFDGPLVRRYVGDPAQSAQRATMRGRSPAFLADRLSRPLLLVQGSADDRVSAATAAAFAQAAQRAGKPLEYWSVPGAGHDFTNWKDRLKLYRKSERFLARCLGGSDGGFDFYELGYFLF